MAMATKMSLKKWISAALNLIALISISFNSSKLLANFLEVNSKGLYQSLEKENESHCLVFASSTKCEIRKFHIVVVQWLQRNVQKSVMYMQSCCFAYLNLLLFCRSPWHHCRHVSSLTLQQQNLMHVHSIDASRACWIDCILE